MGRTMVARKQSSGAMGIAMIMVFMAGLTGCQASFEENYLAAVKQPLPPADPLAGAWTGTWQSKNYPIAVPARAAVVPSGPNKWEINLEMSFTNAPAVIAWIEGVAPPRSIQISDATIEKLPDGSEQLSVFDPMDIGGWGYCYQAVHLQGVGARQHSPCGL
jgi:hypothetical protein